MSSFSDSFSQRIFSDTPPPFVIFHSRNVRCQSLSNISTPNKSYKYKRYLPDVAISHYLESVQAFKVGTHTPNALPPSSNFNADFAWGITSFPRTSTPSWFAYQSRLSITSSGGNENNAQYRRRTPLEVLHRLWRGTVDCEDLRDVGELIISPVGMAGNVHRTRFKKPLNLSCRGR